MTLGAVTKLLNPEFWDFERKPTSQLSVDWTNPLSFGLVRVWLLNSINEIELLTGLSGDPTSAAVGISKYGRHISFTDGYIDTNLSSEHFQPKEITVTARCQIDSGATQQFILCNSYNGSAVPICFCPFHTNASLRGMAYFSGSWTGSGATTFIMGTGWRTISGVHAIDGSPNDFYYIDGDLDSSASNANAALPVHSSNFKNLRIGSYENNNEHFDGEIEFVFVHDRPLSGPEIKELHRNPYQIFNAISYFPTLVGPVAAPTGRIMSSLVGPGGLAADGGIAGSGGGLAG